MAGLCLTKQKYARHAQFTRNKSVFLLKKAGPTMTNPTTAAEREPPDNPAIDPELKEYLEMMARWEKESGKCNMMWD